MKNTKGIRRNADQRGSTNQAKVMAGEGSVEAGNGEITSILPLLFADGHAVRVDLLGEQIESSHFRKDTSCTENNTNGRVLL